MRQQLLLILVLFFSSTASAITPPTVLYRLDGTTITTTDVDATVTGLIKSAEIPGLALAMFDPGKLAYIRGYGFRDTDKKLPLTTDSVMSAASFSKVAFAYLVLKLVDEKVLDLDRPIYRYLPKALPEYPQYADLAGDERYKLITTRMLLDHTSGFPNWRWFEDDRKLKIHFQPGSKYAYSGEGIDLLQLVVETVTKKPLENLMQERVFGPLHMERTSMVWQPRFESDYANGYDEYGRLLGAQRRQKADAAGSMQTTIADFAKFMQVVLANQGLSRNTHEQMLTPQIAITSKYEFPTLLPTTTEEYKPIHLSYGLAWGLYSTPYGRAFFKEGHDEGWRNYTVCYLPQESGIVIMTNSSNGEAIYKYLLEKLLNDTFNPTEWEGFTPYDKLPPRAALARHNVVTLPPAVLDIYVGRYGEPGLSLTIRRKGDHLSVQENDEPEQDLLAESSADFFSTSSSDLYTFLFDSQSHSVKLILHLGDRDISFPRIK